MKNAIFRIYEDAAGQWRWTLIAPNGYKIADSAEGYKRRASAEHAVDRVTRLIGNGSFRVEPRKGAR